MTETAMNPRHRARHGRKGADIFIRNFVFMGFFFKEDDFWSRIIWRYDAQATSP